MERVQPGNDRDQPGGATVLINAGLENGRTASTDTDLDCFVCLLEKMRLNKCGGRHEAPVYMSGNPFFFVQPSVSSVGLPVSQPCQFVFTQLTNTRRVARRIVLHLISSSRLKKNSVLEAVESGDSLVCSRNETVCC